jgi:hypothetical protein
MNLNAATASALIRLILTFNQGLSLAQIAPLFRGGLALSV